MKYNQLLTSSILILFIFMLDSCDNSSEEPDPCMNGPEISIDNIQASIEDKSTGEITVSATGGTEPYMYSIDGINFQSSNVFSNLEGGDYTLVVKDANDCSNSKMATVDEIPEVFYANQIRPIIDNNCQISGCHGSNSSIPSWETYDDVKAKAELIKIRTSDKSMPPSGGLSNDDIQLISDWVDQGAPNN